MTITKTHSIIPAPSVIPARTIMKNTSIFQAGIYNDLENRFFNSGEAAP